MKKGILGLIASVVVFALVLAWNYFVADFVGDFGGPDDLPPPGFQKVFMDGAAKAAPLYILCVIGAVASITAIARKKNAEASRTTP